MDLQFNIIKSTRNVQLNKLFNTDNIRKLIHLYYLSENECKRNNRLTPDIGVSREKDLISYFKYVYPTLVEEDIDNEMEEDLVFNHNKISLKHSSNLRRSSDSIKVIWTENKDLQYQFMTDHKFKCDLLIIYVRFGDDKKI